MRSSFRRGSKMELIEGFIFVASALELLIPTTTGSASWLFDCGEGIHRIINLE